MDITDDKGLPHFSNFFFWGGGSHSHRSRHHPCSRVARGEWEEGGDSSSSPRLGGFFVAALPALPALQCTALNCPRDEARSRTEDKTLSHGQNRNIARGCR
jgi:hypothetical protein